MRDGAFALVGCSLACVLLYLGTDRRLIERLGNGSTLPDTGPGTLTFGGGTAPLSPGSLGMSCLVDHQGAPCPWNQLDAGHRATNFLFYAAPPASTPPPPHLCVALLDAGQACLDADTVDQAYRQLFDAVLASPHGFHRRNR